jgi:Domain of unknown function (DUF4504)
VSAAVLAWSQEVLAKLQLLRQHLQQALGAASWQEACAEDCACAGAGSAQPAAELVGTHLLLDQVSGLPLLPTLNGWLLGYPAVYLVSISWQLHITVHTKNVANRCVDI